MAEDLGQDAAEYLLNQRSEFLRYATAFVERAKSARGDAGATAAKPGEEIASLDFETPEAAAEVSGMLTELGYENHVIAASIYMLERDLPDAAKQCAAIAEAAERQQQSAPGPDAQDKDDASPEAAAPEAPAVKAVPGSTAKQRAFIEKLHAEGHIPDKALPDDLEKLNIREASEIIKEGIFCREMKEDAKKDPVRVKEEGAQMRKASEKLASERAGRDHEKVIDRNMAH